MLYTNQAIETQSKHLFVFITDVPPSHLVIVGHLGVVGQSPCPAALAHSVHASKLNICTQRPHLFVAGVFTLYNNLMHALHIHSAHPVHIKEPL